MNLEWQLAMKECIEKLCQLSPLIYKSKRARSFFLWILIRTIDSTITENPCGTLLGILRESGWGYQMLLHKRLPKSTKYFLINNIFSKYLRNLM